MNSISKTPFMKEQRNIIQSKIYSASLQFQGTAAKICYHLLAKFFFIDPIVIEFKLNLSFEMTFSQLDVVKCQAQNNCSISVFRNSGISTFTFLFQHPAFTFSLIKRLVEIIKVITQVATK